MRNVIISTESTCDLSEELIKKYDLQILPMRYTMGETGCEDACINFDEKKFYNSMRNGVCVHTSMTNEQVAKEYFEKLLKNGKDILHVCFSSTLSGGYQCSYRVAEELNKTNANKIMILDSYCACGGQGLFAIMLARKADEGLSLKEMFNYAEGIKKNITHLFTVDDLKYLHRGGRISKASKILGGLFNIKPVMHMSYTGELVPINKVIGRQASIQSLISSIKERITTKAPTEFIICHADAIGDANILAHEIEVEYNIKANITNMGPIIGAHCGPGSLAVFFVGDYR